MSFCVLLFGLLAFAVQGIANFHDTVMNGVDFKVVYSGAKCFPDRCNPYAPADLLREYLKGHGDTTPGGDTTAFDPYRAQYPPSSLFWIVPFGFFNWVPALFLWMSLSSLLFLFAALLMAELCRDFQSPLPYLFIALFVATSAMLVVKAQPSAFAISLTAIGVWSFLRDRLRWAGVFAFGLGLALKPQIGCFVLLYFLIAQTPARRRAIVVLVLAGVLSIPGVVWAAAIPAMHNWPHDLHLNIARSSAHGEINDPGPTSYNSHLVTDLQSVFAVFNDRPAVYNVEAFAVAGALLLAWAYIALRAKPSRRKDLLGIAAVACLSLLPSYHRNYDLRLLILAFPAFALMLGQGGWKRIAAIVAPLGLVLLSHPTFIRDHFNLQPETTGPIKTILLLRTCPVSVLLCSIVFLVSFAATLQPQEDPLVAPLDAGEQPPPGATIPATAG